MPTVLVTATLTFVASMVSAAVGFWIRNRQATTDDYRATTEDYEASNRVLATTLEAVTSRLAALETDYERCVEQVRRFVQEGYSDE